MSRQSPVLIHHALAAYAEPLAARRRVAVFGEDESVRDRLLDLGARDVRMLRPDDDLGLLPTGAFELALVTDLGAFDAPEVLLAQLRRILGESGAALVVAGSADEGGPRGARRFDYYQLFDLVAREFADVKMVAQVPFQGVVLAELGLEDDSPAVSVDSQLVEEQRPPQAYVALASQRGVALEAYAIFELPGSDSPGPAAVDLEALTVVQTELAREKLRAEALAAQLDTLRPVAARVADLEREVSILRPRVAQVAEVEREFAALRPRLAHAAELEREMSAARPRLAQAAELEREVLGLRSQMARAVELEREVLGLRSQVARAVELEREVLALRSQVARAVELEREVAARGRALAELSSEVEGMRAAAEAGAAAAVQMEALARRADRAERALASLHHELEGLPDAHVAELQRFEATLRERAAAVRALEVEMARRERMVHELLATLEEQRSLTEPAPAAASDAALDENTRLRERLDAMAIELARREGDAQASGWKLAELERRLAEASSAAAPPSETPSASAELAAALDEIDALRRALTQEHEQRVRAEGLLKRPAATGAEPVP